MIRERGHIEPETEQARKIGRAISGLKTDEDRLEKTFARTYGQRTFKLIRHAGIERRGSFGVWAGTVVKDVMTSEPLIFQLPIQPGQFGLRFELASVHQAINIPGLRPRHTLSTSAELVTIDPTPQILGSITLDKHEFVSGTPVHNEEVGYSRAAVDTYSQKIAVFGRILTFGETIAAGQIPEELLDYSSFTETLAAIESDRPKLAD